MSDNNPSVVICGAGVIGICTAYFLAKKGIQATVVEKNVIAGAASGNAGGFLARDWNRDSALNKFSELSFDLHDKLAQELNGEEEFGYRRLDSYSVNLDDKKETRNVSENVPSWLDGVVVADPFLKIGSPTTTAQVHPFLFCKVLHQECVKSGVKFLVKTEVTDIQNINDSTKIVVLEDGTELFADTVVISMGPWSGTAKKWIPSLPSVLYGQKAHAVTMIPDRPVTADAIFTSYANLCPDIYPRPGGEVYSCGITENPKPSRSLESAEHVTESEGACDKLKSIIDKMSTNLSECKLTSKKACYIPITQDGLPLIGNLPKCDQVFIAAGHGCWGILNAPITGLVLSQLILDKSCSIVDVSPFDPSRFSEQQ